jgi:hypothetical protein
MVLGGGKSKMKTGEMITVEGKAGKVTAQVLDVRAADELPDLPVDVSDEARKILADEFRNVAVIAYRFGVERIPVMFVALEDEQGIWWDLRGHQLSITPATAADATTAAPGPGEGSRSAPSSGAAMETCYRDHPAPPAAEKQQHHDATEEHQCPAPSTDNTPSKT